MSRLWVCPICLTWVEGEIKTIGNILPEQQPCALCDVPALAVSMSCVSRDQLDSARLKRGDRTGEFCERCDEGTHDCCHECG